MRLYLLSEGHSGTPREPHVHGHEVDNVTVLAAMTKLRTRSIDVADLSLNLRRNVQSVLMFRSGQFTVDHRDSDRISRKKSAWWEWALLHRAAKAVLQRFHLREGDMVRSLLLNSNSPVPGKGDPSREPHASAVDQRMSQGVVAPDQRQATAQPGAVDVSPTTPTTTSGHSAAGDGAGKSGSGDSTTAIIKAVESNAAQRGDRGAADADSKSGHAPPEGCKDAEVEAPRFRLAACFMSKVHG